MQIKLEEVMEFHMQGLMEAYHRPRLYPKPHEAAYLVYCSQGNALRSSCSRENRNLYNCNILKHCQNMRISKSVWIETDAQS